MTVKKLQKTKNDKAISTESNVHYLPLSTILCSFSLFYLMMSVEGKETNKERERKKANNN